MVLVAVYLVLALEALESQLCQASDQIYEAMQGMYALVAYIGLLVLLALEQDFPYLQEGQQRKV